MGNLYKPSMFNRVVEKDGNMILYNSMTGSYGIKRVAKNNQEKVRSWLNGSEYLAEDDAFRKLVEYGFMVPIDCDEKLTRKYIQTKCVTDTTLNLVVHLTQDCNFRCVYCYRDFSPVSLSVDTQYGIVNFIRKNINKYKAVIISWFGGEPLMEIDIIEDLSKEIISICRSAGKPYLGIITTNGYLLTPKNVDVLRNAKVNDICVTIDGLQETHDKQRVLKNQGQTFNKIVNNLLYIKNNVKSPTLNITIRSNITLAHNEVLEKYYDYFNNLFGDDRRFSLFIRPVADYGGERVKDITNMIDDMSEVYNYLSKIEKKLKFKMNYEDLNVGGSTCNSKLYNKFTIGCDGSVHKCDESLLTPIGQLYRDGNMEVKLDCCSKWLCGERSNECDNCFFSLCCFMEGCPRMRVFKNEKVGCHINKNEVDALICWVAKSYDSEII